MVSLTRSKYESRTKRSTNTNPHLSPGRADPLLPRSTDRARRSDDASDGDPNLGLGPGWEVVEPAAAAAGTGGSVPPVPACPAENHNEEATRRVEEMAYWIPVVITIVINALQKIMEAHNAKKNENGETPQQKGLPQNSAANT
jgi:hypothetical protein